MPKKRKDDHKHLEATLKYSSPTIGEVGRGGRNCARWPRRAGGARRAGASVAERAGKEARATKAARPSRPTGYTKVLKAFKGIKDPKGRR